MPPTHGDIGLAGAMTFPLLSTPALTVESTSSGMSRIERTLALVGGPYARYLDVCIDADPDRTTNCSRCWKCMRTMLTLEIAGSLDEFVPGRFRARAVRAAAQRSTTPSCCRRASRTTSNSSSSAAGTAGDGVRSHVVARRLDGQSTGRASWRGLCDDIPPASLQLSTPRDDHPGQNRRVGAISITVTPRPAVGEPIAARAAPASASAITSPTRRSGRTAPDATSSSIRG